MAQSSKLNLMGTEISPGKKTPTIPLVQRDISWLSFNYRVLQEAKDKTVPLIERIRFLAIYSSNLDEFYRVRVAQHRNLIRVNKKTKRELSYDPKKLLRDIYKIVNKQLLEFSEIFFEQIIPELRENNIYLLRRLDMSDDQKKFVEDYFKENLLPYVQPVILIKDKIRVFLNNRELYLAMILQPKERLTTKTEYAIIKIPSDYLPRFIELPSRAGRHDVIMIDDLVRQSAAWLFPGYDIVDTYSIKLSRDAELYIDDEFSGNIIEKVRESLQKRNVGPASRFIYDRAMPKTLLEFLTDTFELEPIDLLPEGRYHNNSDFANFPDFGIDALRNKSLPPIKYEPFENQPEEILKKIKERDHLLYFPFQSYESVIHFFDEAAKDPSVTHIKIVQYRVAQNSRIMRALIEAVKQGKQVTVFIEVKARFDEQANLQWYERLMKAGVNVRYSMPGIKVHAKLALVIRRENKKDVQYAYLSTGNFNESTARFYTDWGLFTADTRLTNEVTRVFKYLETANKTNIKPFENLLVGQFNLRDGFLDKIDEQIARAKAGKSARIVLKVNSLEDGQMIARLYKASNAGVKVRIIVRGICCLVTHLRDYSENIKAVSIVDRFLEHARVFIFETDTTPDIYLSSADWMERNLSFRVETAFPIFDETLKRLVLDVIDIQLKDNTKARVVHPTQNNYKKSNSELAHRSQVETYFYFKNQ